MNEWTRSITYFSIVAGAVLLSACDKSPAPPPVVPNKPSSEWTFVYSPNMPKTMKGNKFTYPDKDGVHYVLKSSVNNDEKLLDKTITLKFKLTGTGTPLPVPGSDEPPATVSVIIFRKGDNWQNRDHRWWFRQRANLTSVPGEYSIVAHVEAAEWGNVDGIPGDKRPGEFASTANNVGAYGFTFGGKSFAGHGQYAKQPVEFELLEWSIK